MSDLKKTRPEALFYTVHDYFHRAGGSYRYRTAFDGVDHGGCCDMMREDEKWMRLAQEEAELAMREGEVPVGAVIVQGDRLLSRAHNRCEKDHDATAHAEMLAIRAASAVLGRWRMEDCTLYVTLEPCPMCTGALINARIGRVVFAARDARAGAMGSLVDLPSYPLQIRPSCTVGVLQDEAQALLRRFFEDLRRAKDDPNDNKKNER